MSPSERASAIREKELQQQTIGWLEDALKEAKGGFSTGVARWANVAITTAEEWKKEQLRNFRQKKQTHSESETVR